MNGERGAALVIAVMGVFLMTALGVSLAVMTSTEIRIAANYANAIEARYAAEAGLEIGMQELRAHADWNAILAGGSVSAFADGQPSGTRQLSDGSSIDLTALTNQVTAENPTWRLLSFGPVNRLHATEDLRSNAYIVVWVGDDPAKNPAVLTLRAEAFGPAGTRRALEASVSRTEEGTVRMLSWGEIR